MRWVAPWSVFALALVCRLLPWPSVFWSGEVYPAGNDAYYHFRRIAFMVERFPEFLGFDRYLNFPHGGRAIWTPLFDGVLGALTRVVIGPGQPDRLEAFLVLVPPLLGACTVLATYVLARRFFSLREAWAASLLLALLPAASFHSQLGFLDHHAAIALMSVGLLAATLACAEASSPGRSAVLGLAMGAALLLWPGCLFHVVVAQSGLIARALVCEDRAPALRGLSHVALASAVAALVLAPLALSTAWEWQRWSPYSPMVLSAFQPLWVGASAAWLGAGALVLRLGAGQSRRLRVASFLAATAVLALAVLASGSVDQGIGDVWNWLAAKERFQSVVAESSPLFVLQDEFTRRPAERFYSRAIYLVPVALGWFAWRARSRLSVGAVEGLWLWWTAAFAVGALAQFRFANSFAAAYALLIARFGWVVADEIGLRLRERSLAQRRVAIAVGTLAIAWLAWPSLVYYRADLGNLGRIWRGEPSKYLGVARIHPLLTHVARWIGQNTPPTSGYYDPTQQPEYGVLAAWGDGHLLRYRSQRPVVQDNFGDDVAPENVELSEQYFASEVESDALAILRSQRVRYVVVRPGGSGFAKHYRHNSLFTRLLRHRGSAQDEGTDIPALAHHRLRYETPAWEGLSSRQPAGVQVFEIVRGARIGGRATPGAVVRGRLEFEIAHRQGLQHFTWSADAIADEAGCYQLTVPHTTERRAGNVVATGRLELSSGSQSGQVPIPAAAVLAGRLLPGPDLDPRIDADAARSCVGPTARERLKATS